MNSSSLTWLSRYFSHLHHNPLHHCKTWRRCLGSCQHALTFDVKHVSGVAEWRPPKRTSPAFVVWKNWSTSPIWRAKEVHWDKYWVSRLGSWKWMDFSLFDCWSERCKSICVLLTASRVSGAKNNDQLYTGRCSSFCCWAKCWAAMPTWSTRTQNKTPWDSKKRQKWKPAKRQ